MRLFVHLQITVECTDKHASCEPEYISIWQKALSALQAFGEPPQVSLQGSRMQTQKQGSFQGQKTLTKEQGSLHGHFV
eukprot:1148321-Pelagomonas_calceolata.AAC.2